MSDNKQFDGENRKLEVKWDGEGGGENAAQTYGKLLKK